MDGGKIQSILGMAVAKMELAKRDALEVMEHIYPQMIPDPLRSDWLRKLWGAHTALLFADHLVDDVAAMLDLNGQHFPNFPEHPEVSEQSTHDRPALCKPYRLMLKEVLLTLKLARTGSKAEGLMGLFKQIDDTISKADQFLADPQQVEKCSECGARLSLCGHFDHCSKRNLADPHQVDVAGERGTIELLRSRLEVYLERAVRSNMRPENRDRARAVISDFLNEIETDCKINGLRLADPIAPAQYVDLPINIELLEASKQVEEWWLIKGQHYFLGAPAAMFNLREAIAKAEGRTNA